MKADTKTKIADAAWRLAAKGWNKVTLAAVAKTARVPFATLKKYAVDEAALLPLMVAAVTDQACAQTGKPVRGALPCDVIFDHLMARLDVLQNHRAATLSIFQAALCAVPLATVLLKAQHTAMCSLARQSGFKAHQISPASCVLLGVYLDAVRVWRHDQSLDMARTMASLDRRLRLAERLAAYFGA